MKLLFLLCLSCSAILTSLPAMAGYAYCTDDMQNSADNSPYSIEIRWTGSDGTEKLVEANFYYDQGPTRFELVHFDLQHSNAAINSFHDYGIVDFDIHDGYHNYGYFHAILEEGKFVGVKSMRIPTQHFEQVQTHMSCTVVM